MTTVHGPGAQGIHYCPHCDKYFDSPTVHMDPRGASFTSVPVTNGGQVCDSIIGPCNCGATHYYEKGKRV